MSTDKISLTNCFQFNITVNDITTYLFCSSDWDENLLIAIACLHQADPDSPKFKGVSLNCKNFNCNVISYRDFMRLRKEGTHEKAYAILKDFDRLRKKFSTSKRCWIAKTTMNAERALTLDLTGITYSAVENDSVASEER